MGVFRASAGCAGEGEDFSQSFSSNFGQLKEIKM